MKLGAIHINFSKINLRDIPIRIEKQADMIFEMTENSSVALHTIMVAGINWIVILASITVGDKVS